MEPLTAILAVTDLSPAGDEAVRRAAAIARAAGAKLELLHVIRQSWLSELRAFLPDGAVVEPTIVPDARRSLESLAATLDAGAHPPLCVVEVGHPDEWIAAAAAWHDLVVAGAHGQASPASVLLGSTIERALRRTSRPVIVTRIPASRPYRRVVAAIDFSAASLDALRAARRVAPGAHFTLVHALDVEFEGRLLYAGVAEEVSRGYRAARQEEATPRLRAIAGDDEAVVVHGYPSRAILDLAAEREADLIVAGKRGQSNLADLLLGSVTRHLLAEAKVDVLV